MLSGGSAGRCANFLLLFTALATSLGSWVAYREPFLRQRRIVAKLTSSTNGHFMNFGQARLSSPGLVDVGLSDDLRLALTYQERTGFVANFYPAGDLFEVTEIGIYGGSSKSIDAILPDLAQLKSVERLKIGSYFWSDRHSSVLEYFPNLAALKCQGNISDRSADFLCGLLNLSELHLNSEITDAGIRRLGKLPALKRLTLISNRVTGSGIGDFPALETLEVYCPAFSPEQLEAPPGSEKLTSLIMQCSQITDADGIALGALAKLRTLTILGPNVGDSFLRGLARSRTIEELSISLNDQQFTAAGAASLRKLQQTPTEPSA